MGRNGYTIKCSYSMIYGNCYECFIIRPTKKYNLQKSIGKKATSVESVAETVAFHFYYPRKQIQLQDRTFM